MKKLTIILMLVGGIIGGFAAQCLISFAKPVFAETEAEDGILKATEFQLVTDTGRVMGALRLSRSGDPQLVLMDRGGTERFGVYVTSAGPELSLNDSTSNSAIAMQIEGGSKPVIKLGKTENQVRLGRLSAGNYGVGLTDASGKDCGGLAVSPNGSPGLFVISSSGEIVWKTN